MTDKPIADKVLTCVARRHLNAAAFVTYDAMLAVALAGEKGRKEKGEWKQGDSLICFARVTRLANMNDRNKDAENDAINELERLGWILSTKDDQRRRLRAGTFTSNEWRVLTHDEFITDHPDSCPPPRYNDDGKLIKRGQLPRALRKGRLRVQVASHNLKFADERAESRFLDLMLDHAPTRTENPVAEQPTVTENPVAVNSTMTENPVTTVTENPVATVTENPVTRFGLRGLGAKPPSQSLPSILPACNEPVFEKRTDGRVDGLDTQGLPPLEPAEEADEEPEPEMTPEEEAEMLKSFREHYWSDFLKNIPDEMRGAVATKEQREKVINHLDGKRSLDTKFYLKAMVEWIKEREMPIEGRKVNKWGAWLDECAPFLEKARAEQRIERCAFLRQQCQSVIRRTYPDAKRIGCALNVTIGTAWAVVRTCDGIEVDVYDTKECASTKAQITCRPPTNCKDSHAVRSVHSMNGW